MLIGRTDFLGKTVVAQAGLLKLMLLKETGLLGQILLGKTSLLE